MTRRTAVTLAITGAAALAGAAPVVGQTTVPEHGAMAMHDHARQHAAAPSVLINDAGYSPSTIVVAPGGEVTWSNRGANPHTVTSDTGAFDSGTLMPKAGFQLAAPAATGTYAYHCNFHAFMHGTIVVSTLTLQGPRKAILYNKAASVHGAVPGGAPGTPVTLESLVSGTWKPVATTALAANSTFHASVRHLKRNTTVRAQVGDQLSPSVYVLVAAKVTLKRAGHRTFRVTVRPAKAGRAKLQRLNTDTFRWANQRTVRISRAGRAKVKVPKAGIYRIELAKTKTMAAADSPSLRYR
jgi:plastocyanin